MKFIVCVAVILGLAGIGGIAFLAGAEYQMRLNQVEFGKIREQAKVDLLADGSLAIIRGRQ